MTDSTPVKPKRAAGLDSVSCSTSPTRSDEGRVERRAERVLCPLCSGTSSIAVTTTDRNRRTSDVLFTYRRCMACDLLFLADPPADLRAHYAGNYHRFPSRDRLDKIARRESHKLAMLTPWVSAGRLVEVGPGAGAFALQARNAGFDVHTVEMDERCCEYLRAVVGVPAVNSDRPEQVLRAMAPSMAIVLWQVIEHLRDPWTVLQSAAETLEPGGVLLVATPNPRSFGLKLLRRHWPHLDAPRHLTLIPHEALTAWLEARGLSRVALSTDDPETRKWNRFGWQRAVMNAVSKRPLRAGAFCVGSVITLLVAPYERRRCRSSCYTAIFRKNAL